MGHLINGLSPLLTLSYQVTHSQTEANELTFI